MATGHFFTLASIEAARPVFLIVMGVFLMLIAWRLAKTSDTWTARLLVSGAFLLGLGYTVIMPLYQAGVIESVSTRGHYHGSAATAVAWQSVKLVVMNFGWLIFGLGIAMHAKVFNVSSLRHPLSRPLSTHESIVRSHS